MVSRLQKMKDEGYYIVYKGNKPDYTEDFNVLASGEESYTFADENIGFENISHWDGFREDKGPVGGTVGFISEENISEKIKSQLEELSL